MNKIVFFSDDHFGCFAGRKIADGLKQWKCDVDFHENEWTELESGAWVDNCALLVLHMIGGSSGTAHPNEGAERAVRRYCECGKPVLLLHGSSAAFWQWSWWRKIVGLRWVRPDDPDGIAQSTHPVRQYRLEVSKTRHELVKKLNAFDLPEDEIYINMECTSPFMPLMETKTDEGTFVQCWESLTPWNGKIIGFLPGHNPDAVAVPGLLESIRTITEYLMEGNVK